MIEILKELMKVAIKINNKLYERAMKKRYNDLHDRTDIYTETHISYCQDGTEFFERKNNFYAEIISMKLNFTQQCKEKNLRTKQDNDWNKNIKMCYSCDKSDYFMRNCQLKNMMQWWQINAMLREKSENWIEKDTWEKTDSNLKTSELSSDDDYFHIDSMKEFQNALEEKNSEEIIFMKTVNQLIEKIENEWQQRLQNREK